MQFYLWLNSALYLLFAVWCTVKPANTAANIGYVDLNNSGRSEYLVIYGGLQLGLALIFGWLAVHREFNAMGVVLSVLLYAPLVLYRMATLAKHWPVGGLTLATAGLEAVLLFGALVLWWRSR